jgi:hypothetical protein
LDRRGRKKIEHEDCTIILHGFYRSPDIAVKKNPGGYRMHGRCVKCIQSSSKNLKVRAPLKGVGID